VSIKPKQGWPRNNCGDLLPATGKENIGVMSKAMSSLNKGSLGILFGEPIHIGNKFRGRYILKNAQFELQEEKILDKFWGMFHPKA
jgi:hypothetical protein